jgi:hypothetical protein
MAYNVGGMKRSGERDANVSTDTKPRASDKLANCTKPALFYDRVLAFRALFQIINL